MNLSRFEENEVGLKRLTRLSQNGFVLILGASESHELLSHLIRSPIHLFVQFLSDLWATRLASTTASSCRVISDCGLDS